MFLKKITGIKTVGRFNAGGVSGGEYAKYTLFYAGNGRGKTTLCAMLRSLQENDPVHLLKRRTFGSAADQQVQLLLDTGPIKFGGGAWSAANPDIHIFDQHFINANVHGGHQIAVDHRRNFYRVVVGPNGVKLAGEIDALDAQATAKQSSITAEKKVLQQHVPRGMTLEAFLKLAEDSGIDTKIAAAEKTLKAVESADAIAKHAALIPVSLPSLPASFEVLMAKGLPEVSADAAARVRDQISAHGFHAGGEAWLSVGLEHVKDDKCPFCSASVAGNDLVNAYQGYFSQAYSEHKAALDDLAKQVDDQLGEAAALKAHQGFTNAERDAEFWRPFADLKFASPARVNEIEATVQAVHAAAADWLTAKISAPLEIAPASAAFTFAAAAWDLVCGELNPANGAIVQSNLVIAAVKEANAKADKAAAEAVLAKLKAVKTRHSEPFLGLAKAYETLAAEKDQCVKDKDAKKDELDTYDAAILGAYEKEINAILTRFNAGFRLAKCGKNYVGKTPQSEYCLQFDGNDVDVSKADGDQPTFDSTMSAGDKSTFALAFFLAQLNRDTELQNKLVVFDDPFTSLDDFRREMTAKAIVRVGETASQVLVFSHDKYFLDAVRQKIHGAAIVAMQISGTVGNSALEPWDIEREVKEGYLQDHMTVVEYAAGVTTDAKPIRTMLRPLLEKYIRYRFPNQIQDGHWLGDILQIIRDDAAHPLLPQYQELDDINEFTAPFHHDPNTTFNSDEVLAHAKRTLAIVGGC
ncbi:MAG: AAA family ATPase [Methylocella sp.]